MFKRYSLTRQNMFLSLIEYINWLFISNQGTYELRYGFAIYNKPFSFTFSHRRMNDNYLGLKIHLKMISQFKTYLYTRQLWHTTVTYRNTEVKQSDKIRIENIYQISRRLIKSRQKPTWSTRKRGLVSHNKNYERSHTTIQKRTKQRTQSQWRITSTEVLK